MPGCQMQRMALALCIVCSCCGIATAETWRLKDGRAWEPTTAGPEEQYRHAIAEIKEFVQAGQSRAARQTAKQLRAEFPDRVGPDLDLFVEGELHYWKQQYGRALVKYERLLKDYPRSEFADLAMEREYDMALAYLQGRKRTILGLLRVRAYDDGVEIMERITDRAGLDEADSLGLKAAIAVAEHYERTEQYLEAYAKWAEIASYWEAGPIGKQALYRMAEDNLLAYDKHPPGRRHLFDASKLTAARAYYEKFLALYREDAVRLNVPEKIEWIDELMAYKQYMIGRYYQRTGEPHAAFLYFDMVIQTWPKTEAAQIAREALEENQAGGK